jgi:TPR repeat protein
MVLGVGTYKNDIEGIYYLEKALSLWDKDAAEILGFIYYFGEYVKKDYE